MKLRELEPNLHFINMGAEKCSCMVCVMNCRKNMFYLSNEESELIVTMRAGKYLSDRLGEKITPNYVEMLQNAIQSLYCNAHSMICKLTLKGTNISVSIERDNKCN